MWTLIKSATAAGPPHVHYRLYAANIGQAEPFAVWYLERIRTTAAFIGSGQQIDYANWVQDTRDSTTAWANRATLTYAPDLLPAAYAGDSRLQPTAPGGDVSYIAEIPPVTLPTDLWVDVTANMTNGSAYRFIMPDRSSGRVLIASANPNGTYHRDDLVGVEIGHQDAGRLHHIAPFKYTGTPIWVITAFRGDIKLQILEVG